MYSPKHLRIFGLGLFLSAFLLVMGLVARESEAQTGGVSPPLDPGLTLHSRSVWAP